MLFRNTQLGKAAVKGFVEAFDIPGLAFVPLEISGGDQACCFCWKVTVNGNDGPQGISFYEVDGAARSAFIAPPKSQTRSLKRSLEPQFFGRLFSKKCRSLARLPTDGPPLQPDT